MRTRSKSALVSLFYLSLAAMGLCQAKPTAQLDNISFQGQPYSLAAYFSPPRAGLTLKGKTSRDLSAGLDGENIYLGTRIGVDSFYVFWLNYRKPVIRLAVHDFRRQRSRVLPLSGFSFIGLPEIIEADGRLRALVFLGNRSDNDDIYYYEPEAGTLVALTATPYSEKGFALREGSGQLEIETRSLRGRYRYRFDPRHRQTTLLQEDHLPFRREKSAFESFTANPEYYNTFIGFGDSITWGKIDGVQRLDLCYLTRMGEILAGTYGPSQSVNLGVPADQTFEGALRVNHDLDSHPAFYFLLMLGVNDVWRTNFSLASSLENLEFIIDAAQDRHMRVIASTLTPRKDSFSQYQYYWDHLYALSSGIIELARDKGAASIDTLGAFMAHNPPNGWKSLLEGTDVGKGNHPNGAGHMLIASLFAPVLVGFPPQPPQEVTVIDPQSTLRRTASWSVNYESDLDHFTVEFGFLPEALDYALETAASYCTFNLFPFLPELYFRVRAVDRAGNQSDPVSPSPAAAPAERRPQRDR